MQHAVGRRHVIAHLLAQERLEASAKRGRFGRQSRHRRVASIRFLDRQTLFGRGRFRFGG